VEGKKFKGSEEKLRDSIYIMTTSYKDNARAPEKVAHSCVDYSRSLFLKFQTVHSTIQLPSLL
jgi:hypothetical protein